jgi:peptide/nickel transport system permease protein
MGGYALRRVLRGLITVWLVTLIVFSLLRMTGNPIDHLANPSIQKEDRARMMREFGLDKPYYVQYLLFNKGIFQGNFGVSVKERGDPAFQVFKSRIMATVQLVGAGLAFSMVLGLILGVISAAYPDSLFDRFGKILAITGQAMPAFWLGLLMILLFSVKLNWLPSAGGLDRVGWKGIIMPATSLGWFLVAANMRLVRSSMLDVLDSDYIKMLRAKGLPSHIIIWKHALRNAALPVITLFGVNLALLVGGALVTEKIFSWPGIGLLLVDTILLRDYAVVQTVVFFSAIVIVGVNILVDLAYAWLDPRVRLA